jgi:hypothetical protein
MHNPQTEIINYHNIENSVLLYDKNTNDALIDFKKRLNQKPENISKNKFANNTDYIPISFLETMLDEDFNGLWQFSNFHYQVIVNELSGVGTLKVFHPVAMQWLEYDGAGAVVIRQEKGAGIDEVNRKIKNALVMDLPHLKSECFRNACKLLGTRYGRDLNREFTDKYAPDWNAEPRINNIEYKILLSIINNKKIPYELVTKLIAEHGFAKGEDITKDKFILIKNQLEML